MGDRIPILVFLSRLFLLDNTNSNKLPFNKRLNKGQQQEGTVLLGEGCAWRAQEAAINILLRSSPVTNNALSKIQSASFMSLPAVCVYYLKEKVTLFLSVWHF